jgi:GNAT superfamily N-acetyltransferase
MNIIYRKGTKADIPELLNCIRELAAYEKAANQVEVDETELERDGFGQNPIYEFLVAEKDKSIIGIALYYYKYSTWKGKALFLEDLIVKQEHRRSGAGKNLFIEICKIAQAQKCRRMDWQVLDWNAPAIEFYKKFDAKLDPEWLDGRLFKDDLERISKM